MKLVFLLEEPSTKYLLDILLPKILTDGVEFQTIPHNGKRALEKSIPRKLRGWNEPGDLRRLIPEHQKIEGAKRVAPHMDIENNTSESFQQFVSGVRRFVNEVKTSGTAGGLSEP